MHQCYQRWKPSSSQSRLVGELAFVTVMIRCGCIGRGVGNPALALPALETVFLPAQAHLECALSAILILWYCLEGGQRSMPQRFQRWKPSSSQSSLVGELALVTIMTRYDCILGGQAPAFPALETLFLSAQARWEVGICDCDDVCSLAPALPALESLFPPAPAHWEWAGVSVMVRCDCPG